MRILDPGPKAIWRHGHNGRGLMSVDVEFEADQELFKSLVTMLNENEKFYALTGSYKVPVVVREIFRPAPAFYADMPKARVRLHSVGVPEPYMQIGMHARPGFVDPLMPSIPKLWDVPLAHPNCRCEPIYKVPIYHDVMYKHKDFGISYGFLAGTMEQARGRLQRSIREKIDAMMTGTLETKHKEKKVMDKKTLKANRFYVGSPRALRDGWGKPTLAEAVEHAKEQLEATGNEQFVVQIVRVVKKKEQPVIVETVK